MKSGAFALVEHNRPSFVPQRRRIRHRFAAALVVVCAWQHASRAQLFERATVIENARIVTNTGPALEAGMIVLKGGRITGLGAEVEAPFLSKKIDASGKTVTPGLIDTFSALAHLGGSEMADPTARAADAIATFAHQSLKDALRHGVTSAYVGTRGGDGINGMAAVVKVAPGKRGPKARVLDEDVALCIDLGSLRSPIKRLKTFDEVREAFKTALDYRIALEDYEEDLEEYLKKLEERRKKKETEEAADEGDETGQDDSDGDAEKDEQPDGEDESGDDQEGDEDPEPEDGDDPDPEDGALHGFRNLAADDNDDGEPESEEKGEDGDEKGDKDDEEKELEKPTKPKPDRKSEVLLRAVDREVPVRVTAHRSADILNAVELAEEFSLDLILEGATEAYLVAEELADADATVVLGAVSRSESFEDNEFRRHSVRNAAALSQAGVSWSIGSGASTSRSARFVGLNAQLAAAHGASDRGWLHLVTARAADALGLTRQAGRLMRGMAADLVIWSGDPGDPGSRVEQVWIDGEVVYDANAGGGS